MKKDILIKCPRCQKPSLYCESNESRPFCSPVCKLEDIGAWAYEEYKIAGKKAAHAGENSENEEDDEGEGSFFN